MRSSTLCHKLHLFSSFWLVLFISLITSKLAYADDIGVSGKISFMESAINIALFKGAGIILVLITLAIMLMIRIKNGEQIFESKKPLAIGGLLAIYGLIMLIVWDVNYVVIAMSLVALSGVVLMFYTGIGKLIYVIGILFLSIYASIEYGAMSRDFFYRVGFLYLLGMGIFFFVSDESSVSNLAYQHNENLTDQDRQKMQRQNARLQEKMERAESADLEANKVIVHRVILGFFLIIVIYMAFVAWG